MNKLIRCYRADCAALISMTEEQHAYYKRTGETFYCASGHGQIFTNSDTPEQKRIRYLEREVSRLERVRWTCPYASCFGSHGSEASLRMHLRRTHGARAKLPKKPPLALPSDAGPNANGGGR